MLMAKKLLHVWSMLTWQHKSSLNVMHTLACDHNTNITLWLTLVHQFLPHAYTLQHMEEGVQKNLSCMRQFTTLEFCLICKICLPRESHLVVTQERKRQRSLLPSCPLLACISLHKKSRRLHPRSNWEIERENIHSCKQSSLSACHDNACTFWMVGIGSLRPLDFKIK